jgi:hypothetical protein
MISSYTIVEYGVSLSGRSDLDPSAFQAVLRQLFFL